jgi:hypothetical protein
MRKGQKTSEATKQKLRVAALGRKLSETTKRKIGEAHKGMKRPETTGQKISVALKGQKRKPHTEEHKRKIGAALKGRKLSKATKLKIGKANKGKKRTPEQCMNLSKIRKGKPAPWVRERMLGSKIELSPKAHAALVQRNKLRALPEDERKRRRIESYRNANLKERYGLSIAEYDKLHAQQGGVCLICKKPCSSGKRLAVDHDHATKKVRGLLCRRCNRGLGHFPTIALLRSALAYAESHQC